MALAQKRHKAAHASKQVKKLAREMSEEDLEDFAKTKHKNLKENRALTFTQFINEDAYVDEFGELKDFSLDPDEKLEVDTYHYVEAIKDSLAMDGATDIRHRFSEQVLEILFSYNSEEYVMFIDFDDAVGGFIRYNWERQPVTIYKDTVDNMFNLLGQSGISFLDGI